MSLPGPARLFTASLVIAVFAPILWTLGPESDYLVHTGEARHFAEHGSTRIPLPAFLFAGLTVIAQSILPGQSFLVAGIFVAQGTLLVLGILLCGQLERAWPNGADRTRAQLAIPFCAMSLMLVTPIHLATLADHNLYHGYIGISVHHNPTVTLLKPLALLAFGLAVRALTTRESTGRLKSSAAVVVALGVLAKPNYAIALLPALVTFAAWRTFVGTRSEIRAGVRVDFGLVALGFVGPACAVLLWQYAYTYSSAQSPHPAEASSAIAFAPLLAMSTFSESGVGGLAARLVASILFPVCVTALYFDAAKHDLAMGFAWMGFAFGAFYTYFMVETGPRFADGNFLWCGQITLFVLFVASSTFALQRAAVDRSARRWICAGVYGLHVISGVIWYAIPFLHSFDPSASVLRDWF